MRRRILAAVLAALLLSGCAQAAPVTEGTASLEYTLSAADQKTEHPDAREITLEAGAPLTIAQGGAYRLTGEQEGQLCIDVQDEIVHLLLEDATLRSYSGPAILVQSAAKLVVTVPAGTASVLLDSSYYEAYPGQEACLFSAADLTINGGGSLQVNGYCADAIRSKDVLKVLGVSVTIRSKGDGLRGSDGVILENVTADIQCEGAAIRSTKKDKPGKGFVSIIGGSLSLIGGSYGIDCARDCYVRDCGGSVYGVIGNIRTEGLRHVQEGLQ